MFKNTIYRNIIRLIDISYNVVSSAFQSRGLVETSMAMAFFVPSPVTTVDARYYLWAHVHHYNDLALSTKQTCQILSETW